MYEKKKIDGCKNNPENSSTTKVTQHIPSKVTESNRTYFNVYNIGI